MRDSCSFFVRKDDLFDRNGVPVNPRIIEKVLVDHEWVAEALVVPVFGVEGHLVPKAYIVPRENSPQDANELLKYCIRNLDFNSIPINIEFIPELPRTFGGKASAQGLS